MLIDQKCQPDKQHSILTVLGSNLCLCPFQTFLLSGNNGIWSRTQVDFSNPSIPNRYLNRVKRSAVLIRFVGESNLRGLFPPHLVVVWFFEHEFTRLEYYTRCHLLSPF